MTTDQLLTVYFTTRKGNQYVYDACTNRVFFFPSPMREILERYQEQSKENLVTNLSTHWTKDYLVSV